MPTARARRLRPVAGAAAAVTVVATVGAAAITSTPAMASPASSSSGRTTLHGSAPAWTHQVASGTVAAQSGVAVRVYLAPRGGDAALEQAAAAISTPGSASYRHFISPAQFRARFAPTNSSVTAVGKWLSSSGFRVTGVEGSHRYVTASGTAAAVRSAFGVTLKQFRQHGVTLEGPDADASVPDSVAAYVSGVDGLDNQLRTLKPMSVGGNENARSNSTSSASGPAAPPPAGFNNARPCSQYYGQLTAKLQADYKTPLPKFHGKYQPYAVCGYVPAQYRIAYGAAATKLTGKGVTVGIIDAYAAPTIVKDANTYATRHGAAAFAAGQFTQTVPSKFTHQKLCGPSGWYGEETLDVEAVHGMAPSANVHYYGAKSCEDQDILDTQARAIDDNKVSIITNSYGEPDQVPSAALTAAGHRLFLQAGMQGISMLFSSGDNGDEVANTGLLQTDSSASDPAVTAVGGTSDAIGANGKFLFETGWGTHKASLNANGKSWSTPAFLYGAGGGFSSLFNRPSYQNGVVNSNKPGRAVPDIAADGDPTTGMLIGETQTFPSGVAYGEFRLGGTSLSSPLSAGMVALASQRAGSRLGFLNPAIYAAAKKDNGMFRDVTPVHTGDGNVRPDYVNGVNPSDGIIYSVRTFNQDSSLTTSKGWDDVTGVGTLNAKFLTSF
jgi:subtilase family serine protease